MLDMEDANNICKILNEYDTNDNWYVYGNYSGRAMYGKTVNGFVNTDGLGNSGNIALAMVEHYMINRTSDDTEWQSAIDWVRENFPNRRDSLGLSTIYY